MADIYWPSSFPAPDRGQYDHKPRDIAQRTEMQVGPPRVRRMQTRAIYEIEQDWTFTQAGYQAFQEFYDHRLAYGTKAFYAPIYRAGAFETHEVRFAKPYTARYISQSEMSVSGSLLVLDTFVAISSGWTLAAVAFVGYLDFGSAKRVPLVTPPNPHTPMKIEVRFEETFVAGGSCFLQAGRAASASPTQLCNILDARIYSAPTTLSITAGHTSAGSRLNVPQNNADPYDILLGGTAPTKGRASVAAYWVE